MFLRVLLPGPMEARSDLGKAQFDLRPVFYRSNAKPFFLYVNVYDNKGRIVNEYALSISGANGQVSLTKREPVETSYDAAIESGVTPPPESNDDSN